MITKAEFLEIAMADLTEPKKKVDFSPILQNMAAKRNPAEIPKQRI